MNSNPKILFMGTPEFALRPLGALLKVQYSISGVITAPDRPAGRKQILAPSPVKIEAEKRNLDVYQPENKDTLLKIVKELRPDLIIVAAFGMILPKELLEIPRYGTLNIHASLLPRHRGASPIQAVILTGEKETGVTLMLMNEKMDEGPILANSKFEIRNPKIDAEELSKELSKLGTELLVEALPGWLAGKIKSQEQKNEEATYTRIIKKEDGKINWTESAARIERMSRAYRPWPSAHARFKDQNSKFKIIKILEAKVIGADHHRSGEVFLTEDKNLAVKCGEGSLSLALVQPEGKKPMTGEEFWRGHQNIIGSVLD